VQPRTRVSYVPSTVLLARTEAVAGAARYDEELRFGEDVDLVWRLAARGTVRYEPASHAHHPIRRSLPALLRQRFDYGTAAAPLARRHPGAVPPVAVSPWSAATWLLTAMGQPASGLAVAAVATAQLPAKLHQLDHPWPEAARLAGVGTWHAWRPLANAVTRTWWPVSLAAALVSRRARRAVGAAIVATALSDWIGSDRSLDPVTFTALHALDDLAYGTGVWVGCGRERTAEPLLPDFGPWPDRSAPGGNQRVPSSSRTGRPEDVGAPDPPTA
jgi:mycofactocin system glycosyltransferase